MELKEKVEASLKKVRPLLQADGGGIDLLDVTEDGVVKVKLTGDCGNCPMSQMTLKMAVKRTIKGDVPEVKEIVT